MTQDITLADFIVIGGGIAGASAGYFLSELGRVVLLERENQPGYHSTGRSAAVFSATYQHGDRVLRALVLGSADFLENPPAGFAQHDLLSPRQMMYICDRADFTALEDMYDTLARVTEDITWLAADEIAKLLPALAPPFQEKALLERHVKDIDVHGLHEGFLRGLRARGGQVHLEAPAQDITFTKGHWQVHTPAGTYRAPIVVNAAGAWVDKIAARAGVRPIGIQPLRRTAILVDPPKGQNVAAWPFVTEVHQKFYFKPDAGRLLVSPMDQTLSDPCDAQPEELDVAYAAHYIEQALNTPVRRIHHRWAGLRNHVADHRPVVGFAPEAPGFFWLAGQGGFGIKTAVALGRITASLINRTGLPEDLVARGLMERDISPLRLFG
ncbi:NAD(P)/FAD-dependent oxidoreductase [Luteithermobacter gelatinilyticus]|uniref:NAD(P)/FAD-dependent oxidoreductase n=1 Tax=Luteithermobacter gelatinilyticus TaxID=2582913 RepID=UPI001AEF3FE1|nr:FAD-binding oxidoreductase [Luteithermobacter gelatinilyticus]